MSETRVRLAAIAIEMERQAARWEHIEIDGTEAADYARAWADRLAAIVAMTNTPLISEVEIPANERTNP